MEEIVRIDEMLAAIAGEIESYQMQRLTVFAEIGERLLPELGDRPEFSELVNLSESTAERIETLKRQAAGMLEDKERLEKEEREKLAARTCYICGTVNEEGAKFCESCGSKLGEPPREYCKACGTMNPAGMKFCGECGAKLEEIA